MAAAAAPRTRTDEVYRKWLQKNRGRCMSCERVGHFKRDCPAPAKLSDLSSDNPLRIRAGSKTQHLHRGGQNQGSRPPRGAYTLGPLTAYNASPTPQIDYIVDTGPACLSYLPSSAGMDARTLRALAEPITVSGVGGTAVVTHVGTAYARVRAFDGGKTRGIAVRFDAAVVPSLQSAGVALISTQSFVDFVLPEILREVEGGRRTIPVTCRSWTSHMAGLGHKNCSEKK